MVHHLEEQWPGPHHSFHAFAHNHILPPGIVSLASKGYNGLISLAKAYVGSYLSNAASFLTHPYFVSHTAKYYPDEMACQWEAEFPLSALVVSLWRRHFPFTDCQYQGVLSYLFAQCDVYYSGLATPLQNAPLSPFDSWICFLTGQISSLPPAGRYQN